MLNSRLGNLHFLSNNGIAYEKDSMGEMGSRFLAEVSATMPVEVIAEKLERTEKAVMAKATRIGADIVSRLRGRRWTRAEVSLFGKFSAEEIAIATCRSIYSVRAMRYKLKKLDEERAGIRIN